MHTATIRALGMAGALVLLAFPSFAQEAHHETIPFAGSVTNPCNGEVVEYTGQCHVVRQDRSGGGTIDRSTRLSCHAEGVGSAGGAYRLSSIVTTAFHDAAGCATGEVNFVDSFASRDLFVSQGRGENFAVRVEVSATFYGCPGYWGQPLEPPVVAIEIDDDCRS